MSPSAGDNWELTAATLFVKKLEGEVGGGGGGVI